MELCYCTCKSYPSKEMCLFFFFTDLDIINSIIQQLARFSERIYLNVLHLPCKNCQKMILGYNLILKGKDFSSLSIQIKTPRNTHKT